MNAITLFSVSAAIVVAGFAADLIANLSGLISAALQVPGI